MFEAKDKVAMGSILVFCGALFGFMCKHPDSAVVITPAIVSILGFERWMIVHDDKVPDA